MLLLLIKAFWRALSYQAHLPSTGIKVKHGGMQWSVRKLEDAVQRQLAEDYLKPEMRRHGILVVTHHRHRTWRDPEAGKTLVFGEVLAHLAEIAAGIGNNIEDPVEVSVVGIDAAPEPK